MIRTIEPPPAAISAAESKMAEVIGGRTHTVINNLSERDRNNTHVSVPHNVYDLRLDTLLSQGPMPTDPTALHMFVGHGETISSMLQLHPEEFLVQGFQYSAEVAAATQRAIDSAAALPEVQSKDFELRMLRIPALNVMAVWLKDPSGKDDRLVPVGPTDPALVVHRPYTVDEFMKIVHDRATFLYGGKDASEMGG